MLHGCLEIQNLSKILSRVSAANKWNIFQHLKRNFVSPHSHVILSIYYYSSTCNQSWDLKTLCLCIIDAKCLAYLWKQELKKCNVSESYNYSRQ